MRRFAALHRLSLFLWFLGVLLSFIGCAVLSAISFMMIWQKMVFQIGVCNVSLYDFLCMCGLCVLLSLFLSGVLAIAYVGRLYLLRFLRFLRSRASKKGLGAVTDSDDSEV